MILKNNFVYMKNVVKRNSVMVGQIRKFHNDFYIVLCEIGDSLHKIMFLSDEKCIGATICVWLTQHIEYDKIVTDYNKNKIL